MPEDTPDLPTPYRSTPEAIMRELLDTHAVEAYLADNLAAAKAERDEAEAEADRLRAELADVRRDLAANEGAEDGRLTIATDTVSRLRDELAAIRDIAYRAGTAGAGDALEEIHKRAARAAGQAG